MWACGRSRSLIAVSRCTPYMDILVHEIGKGLPCISIGSRACIRYEYTLHIACMSMRILLCRYNIINMEFQMAFCWPSTLRVPIAHAHKPIYHGAQCTHL